MPDTTHADCGQRHKPFTPCPTPGVTAALDPPALLGPGARAAVRRLAVEYARGVLDAPASITITDYRHVVRVLVHELELTTP